MSGKGNAKIEIVGKYQVTRVPVINAIKEQKKKNLMASPMVVASPIKTNYSRGNNFEGKMLYEKYMDEQEANMNPNYYGP